MESSVTLNVLLILLCPNSLPLKFSREADLLGSNCREFEGVIMDDDTDSTRRRRDVGSEDTTDDFSRSRVAIIEVKEKFSCPSLVTDAEIVATRVDSLETRGASFTVELLREEVFKITDVFGLSADSTSFCLDIASSVLTGGVM